MEYFDDEIEYKLLEIQAFLSIPDEKFRLNELLQKNFHSIQIQSIILNRILTYLYKFQMFKDIEPFMHVVYSHIHMTLEVNITNLDEFEYILIKTSLTGFIQDYVIYMDIYEKDKVFDFLTQSFGKLSLEPLIINLGLLLKPIYQEQAALAEIESLEEVEEVKLVEEIEEVQILFDNNTKQIKDAVNDWLESEKLDLDNENELRKMLKIFYDDMAYLYDIEKNTELYNLLLIEVNEMLSLKLTVISLMDSLSDSSFKPVPIK
jgi:hypothetical protein